MNITTDQTKYYNEIKRRLTSDFDNKWTIHWNYCEMTSNEGHSFTFLVNGGLEKRKLIYRKWNIIKDNKTKISGILNLNGIKIFEQEKKISLNDIFKIQNLMKDLKTISESIVLDGIDYEFLDYINDVKYKWKLENEMNDNLKKLIEIIIKK